MLDGAEQKQVAVADVGEGYVIRVLRDAEGRLMHDEGEILYETVRGLVEIRVEGGLRPGGG